MEKSDNAWHHRKEIIAPTLVGIIAAICTIVVPMNWIWMLFCWLILLVCIIWLILIFVTSKMLRNIILVFAAILLIIFGFYLIREQWRKDHDQPNAEVNRPFFTAQPKLIIDKFHNVQNLDIIIQNVGKNSANPMFGYTFIFQDNPPDIILMTHPQSFSNDLVVGMCRVIHEPSIKMMKLKGKQYVFLYLHYTDLNSKKKYSQSYYFERVIYKNGIIEYADASGEHKKEMDDIRKTNCSYIEELVNSGADEKTFRDAMKQRGRIVRNITDF